MIFNKGPPLGLYPLGVSPVGCDKFNLPEHEKWLRRPSLCRFRPLRRTWGRVHNLDYTRITCLARLPKSTLRIYSTGSASSAKTPFSTDSKPIMPVTGRTGTKRTTSINFVDPWPTLNTEAHNIGEFIQDNLNSYIEWRQSHRPRPRNRGEVLNQVAYSCQYVYSLLGSSSISLKASPYFHPNLRASARNCLGHDRRNLQVRELIWRLARGGLSLEPHRCMDSVERATCSVR